MNETSTTDEGADTHGSHNLGFEANPAKPGQSSPADTPDAQKTQLEINRLRLELQILEKPWRRWGFWLSSTTPLAVLTPLAALLGLFMVYNTGFFDTQRLLLDTRTIELKREVKELEQKRNLFVGTASHDLIREVETFFLRDLDEVLQGGWLYRENMLSAEMFPTFFSLAPVSLEFLKSVRNHLALVAWDGDYNFTDLEQARLRPSPEPLRNSEGVVEFHCWIPLRLLLGGSSNWLRAHALECSPGYDRPKGETNYSDIMKLRERHRLHFRETFVKQFPPLQKKLKELAAEHKLPDDQIWELGMTNPGMKLTGTRSFSP
jgi:hypothetical protein